MQIDTRYNLHAFSESRQQALLELHEAFAFAYDSLYDEGDDKLTRDAVRIRDLLKSDISDIESAS